MNETNFPPHSDDAKADLRDGRRGTWVNANDRYFYYGPCVKGEVQDENACKCKELCMCGILPMFNEAAEKTSCCGNCKCAKHLVVQFYAVKQPCDLAKCKEFRANVSKSIEKGQSSEVGASLICFEVDVRSGLSKIQMSPGAYNEDQVVKLIKNSAFEAGLMVEGPLSASEKDVIFKKVQMGEKKINKVEHTVPAEEEKKDVSVDMNVPVERIKTAIFRIGGLTCASCVANIENTLHNVDGITHAVVNLMTEKATVEYDNAVLTPAHIAESIEDTGYDAIEDVQAGAALNAPGEAHAKLAIEGMTCASCVGNIENILRKVDGIIDVTVNLMTETASIRYDPSKIGVRDIIERIEDTGYGAQIRQGGGDEAGEMRARKQEEINQWKNRFLSSLVISIPIFVIAMVLPYVGPFPFFQTKLVKNFNVEMLSLLILTTPVQFGPGWVFFVGAYHALKRNAANMDVLVALGTGAAYFFSVFVCLRAMMSEHADTMTVFDTAAMIITFITLGKYLENLTKGRTSEALRKLMELQPSSAILLEVDANGDVKNEKEISIDLVQVNDYLKVVAGTKVPTDGIVVMGESAVDESMVTGESMPVQKCVGDAVIGGSINNFGLLRIQATRVGGDTMLSQIFRLVESAQTNKAPIQAMADKVAAKFVSVVVLIATLVLIFWLIIGYTVLDPTKIEHAMSPFLLAFNFFISVLVTACPCALGLATPTAVMVGTGLGAKYGVLIKGGEALETVHKVNAVLFDKTGTLTHGKPAVTEFHMAGDYDEAEAIAVLGAAESNSEHPLGRAIHEYAILRSTSELPINRIRDFETKSGRGLVCSYAHAASPVFKDVSVLVGNRNWMAENQIPVPAAIETSMTSCEDQGQTAMLMGIVPKGKSDGGALICMMSVADTLRPESALVVSELRKRKIEPWMVTGDNRRTAVAIASKVGITRVFAEVLPQHKAEKVKELQSEGKVVAMVGDGVNDSPALAQADLGVAIGAGTDVAIEAADFVLMRSDVRDIITAFDISRATFNRIQLNFIWAYGYNAVAVPFAAGALYPFGIMFPPWACALAMALSSVSVVSSSLLLKTYKPPILKLPPSPKSNLTPSNTEHLPSERTPLLSNIK